MATKTGSGPSGDLYLELVRRHPLRPIRSEREHDAAIKAMLAVEARYPARMPHEALDYVDVLAQLIERYEAGHGLKVDVSGLTPAEALQHLLTASGLTLTGLARELGVNQGNLSEMAVGRRAISKSVCIKLAERFKVSPSLFLRAG
jgi:HTH-type transcriptional regulator / antitoxin HigA